MNTKPALYSKQKLVGKWPLRFNAGPARSGIRVRGKVIGITLLFALLYGCGGKPKPLFTQLSSSQTNIHFINNPVENDSLSILNYLYYYNGGGVAAGDINNDGLPDVYFTANNKGGNKLYLNKGGFVFEDITAKAGVQGLADWCTGVTMADVNGDGLTDIYVCAVTGKLGLQGHNMLYINTGNQTFTERSHEYGLDFAGYSTQAAFFDYDHDGDLDCVLLNQSMHSTATIGDTSLRRKFSPVSGGRLYRNELRNTTGAPAARFTDVTAQAGIYSSAVCYGLGLAVADLNNDGWEDIYVGNDFHENDYYYINNHNGTFTESGAAHFNHYSRFSMGNDIADYNNDGQPDIVTVDMLPNDEKTLKTYGSDEHADIYNFKIINNGFQQQFSRNCLQQNLGNGAAFSDVGLMDGVAATDWSWCPLFADFDNDGVKDLFISNGIPKRMMDNDYVKFISSMDVQRTITQTNKFDKTILQNIPSGKVRNFIYKGNIGNAFTDMSSQWTMGQASYSTGAAYADFDNDGNLDLVVNNMFDEASVYRNTNTGNNYLSIQCKGDSGNSAGIGAKVYLFNKGKLQYQQLMLTRGFQSSSEARLHFGLDTATAIDSVLVEWPGQSYQLLTNVASNKQLVVEQKNATDLFNYTDFFPTKSPLFTDITTTINVNWKHKENFYSDFNDQYLIPHMLSTAGPKLAIADVNGDGLDDIYACGAKGQAGALFTQTSDGHFAQSEQAAFRQDSASEGVDAIFFDANKDGHPDLYVVSGGNEYLAADARLKDRLYMNDGKGNFTRSVNGLPVMEGNKSVVCAADIDHDGDMDLFVGGRAISQAYGVIPTSYILMNDGKGNFTKANNKLAEEVKHIGMVTSASFADVNKDGWADLVVAGEWMPVTLLMNNKGEFTKQQLPSEAGLWQSVYVTDVDGDGNLDIAAGNYGINSKLHATATDPLRLHVKDMDNNGRLDQLLTYSVNEKEYTFLAKDEIERQLPIIKKTYLRYTDFAGKTVQEAFGPMLQGGEVLQAATLQTTMFKNNGNNNFNKVVLPLPMQQSPVFAWLNVGGHTIVSGGDLYGVIPYEGRYDASYGNTLVPNATGEFNYLSPVSTGFFVRGEVRDIKPIKIAGRANTFVVAVNNAPLQFFSY